MAIVTNYNLKIGTTEKLEDEGVRFVETTEAKVFHAEDLSAGAI